MDQSSADACSNILPYYWCEGRQPLLHNLMCGTEGGENPTLHAFHAVARVVLELLLVRLVEYRRRLGHHARRVTRIRGQSVARSDEGRV